MELLQTRFSISSDMIHLCPFMFEPQQLHAATLSFDERSHFITIGNFRHAPNWDAVLWLKQQLWPLIRSRLPAAELHVYGAYAPSKAQALHDPAGGFHLLGRADSVDHVMQQARVCLAPLRFGAGIKTKLADAMRNGTPNVTTGVGAEGMHGDLPWAGAIAGDPVVFADAAAALYTNQVAWRQAQQHGVAIVQTLFNARRNGDALIARIMQIRQGLAEHRQRQFTGMMLNHHHQRSCEFMSRWIEAKNALTRQRNMEP